MSIVLGQLHHAVLHDVQGRLVLANVVERPLESAFFNTFQEIRELEVRGQVSGAKLRSVENSKNLRANSAAQFLNLVQIIALTFGKIAFVANSWLGSAIMRAANQKANGSQFGADSMRLWL